MHRTVVNRVWHRLQRVWACFYAHTHGYFWLPCPMCGVYRGGHERGGTLMYSDGWGQGVCLACAPEAERKNQLLYETNPPQIVEHER